MIAHSRGMTNTCQTSNRFNKGSLGILSIIKQASINGALFVLSQTVGPTAMQSTQESSCKEREGNPISIPGKMQDTCHKVHLALTLIRVGLRKSLMMTDISCRTK